MANDTPPVLPGLRPLLEGRSIAELIRAVEAWEGPVGGRELVNLLSGPLPLEELRARAEYHPSGRTRVRLCRTEHAELLLLGWLPGQRAPLHGHHGSHCALRVLRGAATETLAEGPEPSRFRTRTVLAGDLAVVPLTTRHEVVNADPTRPLLTLHVYSPPLPPSVDPPTIAVIGGGAR